MATDGMTCPECGSSDIVDDDFYCQSQMVCADCGNVVSDEVLTTDRSEQLQGTDVRYSRSTAVNRRPCRNLIKGLQRLRALCRVLRLRREIEEQAESYYEKAYLHRRFIKATLHKKEVLGGCCVLVSCRLLGWPIAMATITSMLEADPMLLGKMFLDMVKTLKIETHCLINITDILETHCQDYKISHGLVPDGLSEDHNQMSKRATALVELAADTWIVTGRCPIPILMAAIFLAWQSLKPSRVRLKYSLYRFCDLGKVKRNRTALTRVTEIKAVLCRLGKEIPWLKSEITPDNVMYEVEDILKYRHALMRHAMMSHEEALLGESSSSTEVTDVLTQEGGAPSQTPLAPSSQAEQSPKQACEETCAEKPLQPGAGTHNSSAVLKEHDGQEKEALPEANWGKRALFAPPCVRNPKARKVERGKEVTGDEEISDSEIESYLRTPQEVQEFAEAQKMLE